MASMVAITATGHTLYELEHRRPDVWCSDYTNAKRYAGIGLALNVAMGLVSVSSLLNDYGNVCFPVDQFFSVSITLKACSTFVKMCLMTALIGLESCSEGPSSSWHLQRWAVFAASLGMLLVWGIITLLNVWSSKHEKTVMSLAKTSCRAKMLKILYMTFWTLVKVGAFLLSFSLSPLVPHTYIFRYGYHHIPIIAPSLAISGSMMLLSEIAQALNEPRVKYSGTASLDALKIVAGLPIFTFTNCVCKALDTYRPIQAAPLNIFFFELALAITTCGQVLPIGAAGVGDALAHPLRG
eukprot:NODE_1376_length_1161_cov_303.675407.p1 GENE.NODE_1376_length_1161_cov_303.675407~~NODE_1376_length_1161_cov_303.675407.p1  ORF type:complete len:344 (-),score=45.83 NODE_1376_length_1161_cov_303.675407:111-998(-)